MPGTPTLHTHTALANGLRELLRQLLERLALKEPLRAAVALARQTQAQRQQGG